MIKFVYIFLFFAIASPVFAQDATAPMDENAEALSLDVRAETIADRITDKITKERVENLLSQSNSMLKLLNVNEDFFDGRTLGISNYAVMSTLALLLIYGLVAIIVVKILLFGALKISQFKRLHSLSEILEAVNSPLSMWIYANAVYVSFWRFAMSLNYATLYDQLFTVIFTVIWTWLAIRIFDVLAGKTEHFAQTHAGVREVFSVFKKFLRWMIIIIAALVLAGRLGFNVQNFVLSLGIGGAALAFASKDTIANFFGSISLIMDSPFRIGDRIQVAGKLDGTVESIGIRSTRIRNLDNTVSILPNSYLANEYIVNVARWQKRKVETVIGLVYSTTPDQMRAIVADIKRLLVADAAVADDSITVFFKEFAASSLNVTIIYFTKSTENTLYNETVERINLALIDIVSKNGSDMAFPTQTVYNYGPSDQKGS